MPKLPGVLFVAALPTFAIPSPSLEPAWSQADAPTLRHIMAYRALAVLRPAEGAP